jgi:L-threonylcarbamoyladenylate synthase
VFGEVRSREGSPLRVVPVHAEAPTGPQIEEAVQALETGRVIALPTETFYGLAADGLDGAALVAVNRLKGKPDGSPVLLLLSDADQVAGVARELPESFEPLARRFWPGPLTLVLRACSSLPRAAAGGGLGTVAVRVPGLGLPRRLAAALGRPISGPSANRHGQAPPTTAAQVREAFPQGLELLLDGGPTAGTAPSTILDLTGPRPRLLREGALSSAALGEFLGGGAIGPRPPGCL